MAQAKELKGIAAPRQEGPPLHSHYDESEEASVISGTLSAVVDGQQLRKLAGESGTFPAGSLHRWWNSGNEPLVFEGFVKPVIDLDVYLQAAFDVLNHGPAGRPPLFYMAHLAADESA